MSGPGPYLALYGVIALTHLVVQTVLAHLEARRQRRDVANGRYGHYMPSVSVVVPSYNEDADTLRRCLESIRAQDYAVLEAIVVDDGSPNQDELLPLFDELTGERTRVLLFGDNRGKREAQRAAFELVCGEVIVTVDSDTILHDPLAIHKLVQRLADERVGAVTGNVAVENRRDNILTRMLGYRYWNAFNLERAAQSLFGVVSCCSGPFAAYRRDVIDRVKDRYVSQTFMGQRCTYGDDRHLTNLVLAEGYDVHFDGRATVHTLAPTRLGAFIRQQIRWNKSFFRELRWTIPFARRRHLYLSYDLACQALLPMLLITTATLTVLQAAALGPHVVVHYLATILGIGFIRSLYGATRSRDLGFTCFSVYGLVHMLLLKPISLYALATLGSTHWGTRDAAPVPIAHPAPDLGLAAYLSERLPSYDVVPDAVAISMIRRLTDRGLVHEAAGVVADSVDVPYVALAA